MNKLSLLAGVSALALLAVAGDAFACGGNQCTPVNSVVAGNASASGAAFEKAGIAAIGTGNAQVGVIGVASSHSTATLQRDVDCTTGCISGSAATQNYASYVATGTGDLVVGGGLAGTYGATNVDLQSTANNGLGGETALAGVNTSAVGGTLVGSFDIGHGSAGVSGGAHTGTASLAEACASVLENQSNAYAAGDSAYANGGEASGLLAGAGSFGLTHTVTGVATTAADATVVNTSCLIGQCYKSTPIAGVAATGGVAGTIAGAGSLGGDLAFNGTATTASNGYSLGSSVLASSVSLDKTYGKVGEKTEYVGKGLFGLLNPKNYKTVDINGVNGLTGTAGTDAYVAAGAGANGDLVGALAGEEKAVTSGVEILTLGGVR